MKYYTGIVQGLANKLAASGMELKPVSPTFDYETDYEAPVYAVVFDWFLKNGLFIEIGIKIRNCWAARVCGVGHLHIDEHVGVVFYTWHDAANAAIEKAIEILKEKGAEESAPRK